MRPEQTFGHGMEPKIFWPAGWREGLFEEFFQTVLILMGDWAVESDTKTKETAEVVYGVGG